MPDREKVIKGLKICSDCGFCESIKKYDLRCPYRNNDGKGCDRSQLLMDALAMLKEQESVSIEWKYGFPHCPVCGQMLPEGDAVKYCLHCGRPVKW